MRFVIYGAGAVGGVIGARLHAAGREVALIARGAQLEVLTRDGLTLLTPDGEEHHRIATAAGPRELELGAEDVVFLTVKSHDTVAGLEVLAECTPTELTVVCAQNGVANERAALRRFANVVGMCVWLPASP